MAAPSAQNIACGMSATQIVRVANPTRAPVRLRMKLSYVADGRQHQTMFDFSGFPSTVV
ncbi:hypothetical protein GGI05_006683 [Coemansia sp. RSA 2603]|nr:hypothetical protein GGI05_006683 [Coemansia sp. RSA 2603]